MGALGQYVEGGIDPSQHEPSRDFTPLPAGWYPFEIEAAEVKPTKAGDGQMLKITMSVIGEQYNGRKVFPSLNILNKSAQATEIGRRELADVARACGIAFLDDEDKLLGCKLEARLIIKTDKGYEPDNDVKGYRPLGGGHAAAPQQAAPARQQQATPTPQPTQAAQPAQTTQPAAASGRMPWER